MLIRDLEHKTGLDRATIRFYEKEGFIAPERKENGYRTYSEADRDTLLKIKLLRQLGMSLDRIKALQQGKEAFSDALDGQIRRLSQQIEDQRRAREVCQVILSAGESYQSIDAEYYLKLLTEAPLQASVVRSSFEEQAREIHPVRRCVARFLDRALLATVVYFLLIVVIRIRPLPEGIGSVLLSCGIWFLLVPLEAVCLHLLGTTPGKWIMGIWLEHVEGGNLSFSDALAREWQVLRHGIGFGIPIWQPYCMVRSYCKLTGRSMRRFARQDEISEPEEMEWDEQTELIYAELERKELWWLAAAVLACVLLIGATSSDAVKPKYRGDLTVSQFASNYNYYLSIMNENMQQSERLQSDGTPYRAEEGVMVIFVSGQPENGNHSFRYETENGMIRRITYQNRWTDVFFINPITIQCQTAAMTMVMSQKGMGTKDWSEFAELLNAEIGASDGLVIYENIQIRWHIESENCQSAGGSYMMRMEETLPSSVSVEFEILIKA